MTFAFKAVPNEICSKNFGRWDGGILTEPARLKNFEVMEDLTNRVP